MNPISKRAVVVWIVFMVLAGKTGLANTPSTSQRAADFTIKSLNGRNIKLSEHRGRVVILNFWATWCAPCKEELPYFNHLYGKYKDLGLEVLGVNIDKNSSEVRKMSEDLKLAFSILPDPTGKVSTLYKIRSMPTTYVIGKDGMIRHVHWGFGPEEPERYEKEIRRLLRE